MSINEIAEGEEQAAEESGAVLIEPVVELTSEEAPPSVEPFVSFESAPAEPRRRKRSTGQIMRDRRFVC